MTLLSMQLFLDLSQVMALLNQDLAAINSCCLKWHMKLNPKKIKFMVVSLSLSWTSAPGYRAVTLGGAELEELMSLHIFKVTFDSKLTFEIHLREVVSKATKNLGVVRQAGKLFDCHACSKAVSMHMFVPAWSIVFPFECRRPSPT